MADSWNSAVVLADNRAFASGEVVSAETATFRTPAICVQLDALGGLTSDTATIRITGAAASYQIDSRSIGTAGESYVVEAPQAGSVEFESANGATYSVEIRNNPR